MTQKKGGKREEKGKLTTIRASITSLQVCRLVALVTSKNNSLVVFLICEVQAVDHVNIYIISLKDTEADRGPQ